MTTDEIMKLEGQALSDEAAKMMGWAPHNLHWKGGAMLMVEWCPHRDFNQCRIVEDWIWEQDRENGCLLFQLYSALLADMFSEDSQLKEILGKTLEAGEEAVSAAFLMAYVFLRSTCTDRLRAALLAYHQKGTR